MSIASDFCADRHPPQEERLRQAAQALLRWQLGTPAADLPAIDAARLHAPLALWTQPGVQQALGLAWDEAQQRRWTLVGQRLVDSALAQPQCAVHGGLDARWRCAADAEAAAEPRLWSGSAASADPLCGPLRGPLLYDLARLLRDPELELDEAQQLDVAVRWWQQARAQGQLLGEGELQADFGACWQAFEWMALLQHLSLMAQLCSGAQGGPEPQVQPQVQPQAQPHAQPQARWQPLLRGVLPVALRYAPLAPLLALLQPLQQGGQGVQHGFTF